MKIGILTFHRSVNNGAFMQAYSLSKRLIQEYPNDNFEIIDYTPKIIMDKYLFSIRQYLDCDNPILAIKKAFYLVKNYKNIKRLQLRAGVFESVSTSLPLSKFKLISDESYPTELVKYINETYDAIIVGSDAVWNYVIRGFPNIYFPGRDITCRKFSYAASCYGMDFTTCCIEQRERLKEVFDGFEYIGVRDKATENFVKWCGSINTPMHNCDPTVFLNMNDLPVNETELKNKLIDHGFDFNRETIGIMGNEKICSMVRNMYGDKFQIVGVYEYLNGADVNLYDITPYEWAYVFRYFKITFTTFFHGTLFSLKNGIPVICCALQTDFSKSHTPKTLDLLGRLEFSDWYFHTDYQNTNIDKIKSKSGELMSTSLKKLIMDRLEVEADTYYSFKDRFDEFISAN